VQGIVHTGTGTASHPTPANTNAITQVSRTQYLSVATNQAGTGPRDAIVKLHRGSNPGQGGFFWNMRFATPVTVATTRAFFGVTSATGAFNAAANPSTQLNLIGVGLDDTDTNYQIMHNDGSGTATRVNTSMAFNNTDWFDFFLFCAPNTSTVGYRLLNLITGASFEGTISTDMPAQNLMLTWQGFLGNGATASAVTLVVCKVYHEVDI